jgi:hypothetical protein
VLVGVTAVVVATATPAIARPVRTSSSGSAAAVSPAAAAAVPGRRPRQVRPLPATSLPRHGLGPRNQIRDLGAIKAAAGNPHVLLARASTVDADRTGPQSIIASPGITSGETCLRLKYVLPDAGGSSVQFILFDGVTNTQLRASEQRMLIYFPGDHFTARFCDHDTFPGSDGWPVIHGHPYLVAVAITYGDGAVVSARSAQANARFLPPAGVLAAPQTTGCTCPNKFWPHWWVQRAAG